MVTKLYWSVMLRAGKLCGLIERM